MGGISIWQLLIVLALVILIFGTKKLRGLGGDVGSAIKNFKHAMKDEGSKDEGDSGNATKGQVEDKSRVIDAESQREKDNSKNT